MWKFSVLNLEWSKDQDWKKKGELYNKYTVYSESNSSGEPLAHRPDAACRVSPYDLVGLSPLLPSPARSTWFQLNAFPKWICSQQERVIAVAKGVELCYAYMNVINIVCIPLWENERVRLENLPLIQFKDFIKLTCPARGRAVQIYVDKGMNIRVVINPGLIQSLNEIADFPSFLA